MNKGSGVFVWMNKGKAFPQGVAPVWKNPRAFGPKIIFSLASRSDSANGYNGTHRRCILAVGFGNRQQRRYFNQIKDSRPV
jgi:hypothetical protein